MVRLKTDFEWWLCRVSLIDEYQIVQNVAHSKGTIIQKACQLHAHDAQCNGYLFWNSVHPASNTQQKLGKEAFKTIYLRERKTS